ncbi:MAG: hypothetical protein JSS44_01400 [Proteobacteria bacterium]|nr:hypothetical protein [Pseudomonadota bacterium]
MKPYLELDAESLLRQVADRVPPALRANVVVIGSIATAWAFRDISGTDTVATKDIDLLLRPSIDAVATAETLGQQLLDAGWQPQYPNGIQAGAADTPDDQLPALRLSPPEDADHWFVELLSEAPADQKTRKRWRRFHTRGGDFGLPSFRYLRVAVHGAEDSAFGLRIARPAPMALAHLLEHADPDRTPISGLPGTPPRFTKDVGRAIALWWLAREQSPLAGEQWLVAWRETLAVFHPDNMKESARSGLASVTDYLRDAHAIAVNGVLAPHGTTFEAFRRAHAGLVDLIDQL